MLELTICETHSVLKEGSFLLLLWHSYVTPTMVYGKVKSTLVVKKTDQDLAHKYS